MSQQTPIHLAPDVTDQPHSTMGEDKNVKELVMYGRTFACGDQARAMDFLARRGVRYRFVDIGRDVGAATRLQGWVGYLSVPTMVVAPSGSVLPIEEPKPLDPSRRVRGQNRGTMITEPSNDQLESFLRQHQLL